MIVDLGIYKKPLLQITNNMNESIKYYEFDQKHSVVSHVQVGDKYVS